MSAGSTGCKVLLYIARRKKTAKEVHSMDEQKPRFTRLYGNIGCIVGLVVSGLGAMSLGAGDAQMRVLLVAGVLLCAGIGMAIGRHKDKKRAAENDAQSR